MNFRVIFLTLTFITLISKITYGQDCNCENNFEWLKRTFEENDAGYQYTIDKKGQQAYDIHNMLFADKIKSAENFKECTMLLNEWLTFFRLGHIGIEPLKELDFSDNSTENEDTHYEVTNIDITEFEKYITQKKRIDYEGVWELDSYKIGIKNEGYDYVGFIIASGIETWREGDVKLRIINEADGVFRSIYYMGDRTPVESKSPHLVGNNYLQIGQFLLKRLNPSTPTEEEVLSYLKSESAREPYLEEINATTLLLRIPSFEREQKTRIDSVVLTNRDKILETENLIIDLRDNGGGADRVFSELIPFLYTNPIRTIGTEFLSTKLNNQRMIDLAADPQYGLDEVAKEWIKNTYDRLEQNLNEFVNINPVEVGIHHQDTIYTYPKNIGILINNGNASTTEQFLLAAKQSKKVKLFGTTTSGALDVSNMLNVESPCQEFLLWYCHSRSYRIPDMAIDDVGIQPDYFLDRNIFGYKWIDFATEILNQK